MKIAMLLALLPLHAAAQWMTGNVGKGRGYNCLTKDAKGAAIPGGGADCDIQASDHPERCVNVGGQCAMSKEDAAANCGGIEGCAGLFCALWYNDAERCIARSASELAFTYIYTGPRSADVYNMLKPLDTKPDDTKLDTKPDDTKLADSPEGTTPECGPKNGFGTECLAEWISTRHSSFESDTVNKHCTTGTDYHIKCQDCEWCTEFIQPDTQVAKEEFAPMDVRKFKDELARAMVVMMPSKCNARECAHWNCDTWCWCFEHYGHLLQPWLDTYAANAGCLPDGTECACKPPGGITIEDPPLDVDIYEVPPEWVDPLWDPSPLDDIRQQFIAEKFPYIRKYDAPVEDGPGTWGEPTEQEIKAMLQIIDLYLPINNKELTADARIKLMDEFKREMEGNLLKLAGAQMRRPQMQQFRTMATAIGELRASPVAHDHVTARELELHLDTNLRSFRKALAKF